MPLPKPNDGETQDDFIARCMGAQVMKDDFPDNDQRLAVCFKQWKEKDKNSMEPENLRKTARMSDLIERRYTNRGLRLLDAGGEATVVEGYAAVFDTWSEQLGFFKEQIAPGAFKKSLDNHDDVRALINHDPNLIIGRTKNRTLKLREDERGLAFRVKLPNTTYAADLRESIRRKDITQNSFGFSVVRDEWSEDGRKRTLREVKLFDVSPVTFPAYKQTSLALRLLDMGIDYEALNCALIRMDRGIQSKADVDLVEATIEILKQFIPQAAPLPEEHPEPEEAPEVLSTLIRALQVKRQIRIQHLLKEVIT